MSQVTITHDGRSLTVTREVVERQLASAEQRIANLRDSMAVRHQSAQFSAAEQAAADAATQREIERFSTIAAACRAALNA